jgi:hypothetical protein
VTIVKVRFFLSVAVIQLLGQGSPLRIRCVSLFRLAIR